MQNQIKTLDDTAAANILNTIAQSRMRTGEYQTEITPEMIQALETAFDTAPSSETVSPGDLARNALLLLAEMPEYQAPLSALLNGPRSKTFGLDPLTATAVITAALVVLQTHVKIERDKKGKVSVLIEKKPTKDTLLKPIVEKILSCIPDGPWR
ncbi:hypothetical protein DENIS_1569 [Desulfonema ishimotonii]|uniref:Uncharacterized protein n=1 Tax=Desulfonema ishimotonii TaxID=45657 RepID=A0A401FUF7_9BACT|nr:hypothetical protein [Desulfonema ishimotonii]GBC60612.1 hypothetical protein DENIS_1569 [Desulfonema ishimotonii]